MLGTQVPESQGTKTVPVRVIETGRRLSRCDEASTATIHLGFLTNVLIKYHVMVFPKYLGFWVETPAVGFP